MLRRILLIDDDRLQFRLTHRMFDSFHGERFELEWADNFDDGLVRLLKGNYTACLLDYQLGPRDGLELIAAAVAQGCHTPIIFLTAETSENIDTAAMNAGALDYLVKGEITPHSLERSLRYALKLGDTLGQLRQLATTDQLTGLLNRREFDRLLVEEVERTRRFERPLARVLIDLDHFKSINDRHGHPAGDTVLRTVATRITETVRSLDRVARIGGEEFAVLLMETSVEEAMAAAQRLIEVMRGAPMAVSDEVRLPVTISAGVAVAPTHAKESAALIEAADKALYTAKRNGRNRVVLAV